MNRLRLEVSRVAARDLAPDDFITHYFLPEIPVVVSGVALDWPARQKWSHAELQEQLQASPKTKAPGRKLWLENSRDFLQADVVMPDFVRRALANDVTSTRETDCRFWLHPQGNVTHWHFDANALFVFNVQVRGRKEFTLVDPRSPLPSYPFSAATSYAAQVDERAYAGACNHAVVTLEEGDLLFLPPLWQHRVQALTDTINFNWVGTKKSLPPPSPAARREHEILKLASLFPPLAPYLSLLVTFGGSKAYFAEYGGREGRAYVEQAVRQVSAARALSRAAKEGAHAARLFFTKHEGHRTLLTRPMVKNRIFEA